MDERYRYLRNFYPSCFSFVLTNLRVWYQSTNLNGNPNWYVFDMSFTNSCSEGVPPYSGTVQEVGVYLTWACDKSKNMWGKYYSDSTNENEHIYCEGSILDQDPPKDSCPAVPTPVYGETGLKWLSENDYKSQVSTLAFERIWRGDENRFFNSLDSYVSAASQVSGCYPGYYEVFDIKGNVVSHNYCFPLIHVGDPSSRVNAANGNQYLFTDNANVLLPQRADVSDQLTRAPVSGGYNYTLRTTNNVLEQFGPDGLPTTKHWANGEFVHYSYSTSSTPEVVAPRAGLPIEMVNHHGRSLAMTYNANGTLKTLVDPAGGITQYTYDEPSGHCPASVFGGECKRLTSVTYPDGSVRRYHYNEATHVDSSLRMINAYLTGITDETGQRLSNYKYNAKGQTISSGWGGMDYQLAYNPAYNPNGDSTWVTDLLGTTRVATYTSILGRSRPTSQSQPAGSGCNASSKSLSYDAQGNVASKTDFNGTTTVYTHDLSRNLEVRRVESAGQNTARTISTQWHPVWHLKTRVAEPGLITTSVYNGQPDPSAGGGTASCAPTDALLPDGSPIAVLCKRIEQATLDANGSQGFDAPADPASPVRVWQYTYNRFGQTLTEDGPRTDVADITTHIYYADTSFAGSGAAAQGHTLGDLASTTDPSGQTTTYDLYNKHGQLLQSTDPNGIVSTYTYDLRQRLTSASVGGQTTTYTYDPVGQLIQVSLPDGSQVSHTYDPAHRLIASADHLGNRIDYTLDNAGNVIGQNLKDPNGALRHSLQQSRDALGRVQQTQTAQ